MKYNIYIIAKNKEIFEEREKKLMENNKKKINFIIWIPSVFLKVSSENKHILKDLNTRYNTKEEKIIKTLGCLSAHRVALLQIWNHKTNNNIILESDFRITNKLTSPPKETCYLGGWIIPNRMKDIIYEKQININPKKGLNVIDYKKYSIIMTHAIFYKTYDDAYNILKETFINKIKNWDIFLKDKQYIKHFNYPETFIQDYSQSSEIKKYTKLDSNSINYGLKIKTKPKYNLIYMATPVYGGWVSFTAHLALKYNCNVYKIRNRTEQKKNGSRTLRNFGYGVLYQNLSIEDALKLDNVLITAIDKTHYKYLDLFKSGTNIVIHDPTEVSGKKTIPIITNLPRFNVITIRETVKTFLDKTLNIKSKFIPHPFYKYYISNMEKKGTVAISRIDFDKHTDIILKANNIVNPEQRVDIYGAKNDLYIYHKIITKFNLDINRDYKGRFGKCFIDLNNILAKAKYMVDLSAIKNDGGGSQYTFLEAIYQGVVLILNNKWVNGLNSPFVNGINCLVVKDEFELAKILQSTNIDTEKIALEAKKLLKNHIESKW